MSLPSILNRRFRPLRTFRRQLRQENKDTHVRAGAQSPQWGIIPPRNTQKVSVRRPPCGEYSGYSPQICGEYLGYSPQNAIFVL